MMTSLASLSKFSYKLLSIGVVVIGGLLLFASQHAQAAGPTFQRGGTRYECPAGSVGYDAALDECFSTCFIEDTQVTLADGSTKNIQDVRVGDRLRGSQGINTVQYLIKKYNDGYIYGFNGDKAFVTDTHPFMTLEGWKSLNPKETNKIYPDLEVSQLNVGDTFVTKSGILLLQTIEKEYKPQMVYTFGVDGTHDYYADNYLVHNKYAGSDSSAPNPGDIDDGDGDNIYCPSERFSSLTNHFVYDRTQRIGSPSEGGSSCKYRKLGSPIIESSDPLDDPDTPYHRDSASWGVCEPSGGSCSGTATNPYPRKIRVDKSDFNWTVGMSYSATNKSSQSMTNACDASENGKIHYRVIDNFGGGKHDYKWYSSLCQGGNYVNDGMTGCSNTRCSVMSPLTVYAYEFDINACPSDQTCLPVNSVYYSPFVCSSTLNQGICTANGCDRTPSAVPTQTRTVVCKDSSNVTVDDSLCVGPKPATSQTCDSGSCIPYTGSGDQASLNTKIIPGGNHYAVMLAPSASNATSKSGLQWIQDKTFSFTGRDASFASGEYLKVTLTSNATGHVGQSIPYKDPRTGTGNASQAEFYGCNAYQRNLALPEIFRNSGVNMAVADAAKGLMMYRNDPTTWGPTFKAWNTSLDVNCQICTGDSLPSGGSCGGYDHVYAVLTEASRQDYYDIIGNSAMCGGLEYQAQRSDVYSFYQDVGGTIPANVSGLVINYGSSSGIANGGSVSIMVKKEEQFDVSPSPCYYSSATYSTLSNNSCVTILPPVNGVCGSAHGTDTSSAPTTNLCATGAPSMVSGTGPWTWSCSGQFGGSSASCSANVLAPYDIIVHKDVVNDTVNVNVKESGGGGLTQTYTCDSPLNDCIFKGVLDRDTNYAASVIFTSPGRPLGAPANIHNDDMSINNSCGSCNSLPWDGDYTNTNISVRVSP